MAEGFRIAEGAQIHDCLRPHCNGGFYLFELFIQVKAVPGDAEIHIDLCAQCAPNAAGLEAGVIFIRRNDRLPLRDQLAQPFHLHFLLCCNGAQLLCQDFSSRRVHLCCIIHLFLLKHYGQKNKKRETPFGIPR